MDKTHGWKILKKASFKETTFKESYQLFQNFDPAKLWSWILIKYFYQTKGF